MIEHYQPIPQAAWQGRQDSLARERFFQLVKTVDIRNHPLPKVAKPGLAILGFACDAGVKRNLGRVGAALGPAALRKAFANLPVHYSHPETILDVGDIICPDDDLEKAQQALAETVMDLLTHGYKPILFGGGHEIAWGHYLGIHRAYPQQKIGIINFDAHFDLRENPSSDKGSSGTPFRQIAEQRLTANLNFDYLCIGIQKTANTASLFAKARELNVDFILAEELHRDPSHAGSIIQDFIAKQELIYLTICLDAFASHFAPGVSAPQLLGLTPWQVMPLLRQIVHSKKVISVDIAELNPGLDRDNMTAQLGGVLLSEYVHTLLNQ